MYFRFFHGGRKVFFGSCFRFRTWFVVPQMCALMWPLTLLKKFHWKTKNVLTAVAGWEQLVAVSTARFQLHKLNVVASTWTRRSFGATWRVFWRTAWFGWPEWSTAEESGSRGPNSSKDERQGTRRKVCGSRWKIWWMQQKRRFDATIQVPAREQCPQGMLEKVVWRSRVPTYVQRRVPEGKEQVSGDGCVAKEGQACRR